MIVKVVTWFVADNMILQLDMSYEGLVLFGVLAMLSRIAFFVIHLYSV